MLKKKLRNILLIDDSFDENTYHQLIISRMNITDRIDTAMDGEEALTFLRQASAPPELIFLDINMPRMNGWEFLEEYKNLPVAMQSKIVIMMLTTSSDPWEMQRAAGIEMLSGFRTKPLTKEMMLAILKENFADYF